jgi:hypothetical protein
MQIAQVFASGNFTPALPLYEMVKFYKLISQTYYLTNTT